MKMCRRDEGPLQFHMSGNGWAACEVSPSALKAGHPFPLQNRDLCSFCGWLGER